MNRDEWKVDRAGWPPGPWDDEGDRWEGEAAGFPALAVRNDNGAWCGYLGLPPEKAAAAELLELLEETSHGGITFAGPCQLQGPVCHTPKPGQPDNVHWVGFDCAHAIDLVPGYEQYRHHHGAKYRTLAYVREVLEAMAKAAAAEPGHSPPAPDAPEGPKSGHVMSHK